MNTFKRISAIVLAIGMLASIAACGKAADDPANATSDPAMETTLAITEAPQATSTTTDDSLDKNGYLKDDLPDELDYGKDKVSVLYWDTERPEFEILEQTGSLVNDAIYQRNLNVEERLNVDLVFSQQKGSSAYIPQFVQHVQTAYQAGSRDYDIVTAYSRTAGSLTTSGLYYNINSIENNYIDLEKPWWPDCISDTVTIGDAIYFITGDCSTNVLHLMYTMWFNKDLLEQYHLEYPVDLVRQNKWTLDKLFEMTADTYQDLNSNGQKDDEDFFGFVGVIYGLDAFYTGSGLRLVETDDENMLKISPDFGSEKTINLVDMLGERCTSTDWNIKSSTGLATLQNAFKDGRVLFCQNRTYFAELKLLDVDFSYGLVPTPKYDENQEDYVSVLANPITLYGIMADAEVSRLSELTAVLECWGSEAYRLTTPALFETNMKLKYSETSDESEMFDIVRDTIFLDLGRVFSQDLQYMSEIPSSTAAEGGSWATKYAQYQRPLEKGIQKVVSTIRSFQG